MDFKKCAHAGICGGCSLQDRSYQEQIAFKQTYLETLLAPFWDKKIPVTPSPQCEYFRNKIELGFSHQVLWKENYDKKKAKELNLPLEFESTLGFKIKGRWDRALDICDCITYEQYLIPLLGEVRAWAAAENLEYYDQRKHTGVLRHLLLRQGKNTGESMVVLFAAQPDINTKSFVAAVEKVLPNATIFLAITDRLADVAAPDTIHLLKGAGFITEKIFLGDIDVVMKLSPQSFFQTNTKAAELMYKRVRGLVKNLNPQTVYDMYGGAGSFSLAIRDLVKKSVCVESVAPAVYDGQQNMKLNGADNIQFICDTVENFVQKQKITSYESLIILDPPRAGLHPKAENAIANSGVKNVLYISCNPKTLADNLKGLTKNYTVKNVEGFDFFPHTNHVETLVELELK